MEMVSNDNDVVNGVASTAGNENIDRHGKLTKEELAIVQKRYKLLKHVFNMQISLLDQAKVTKEHFAKCARYMQPFDLDDLAEERKLIGLCGYPLCGKKPKKFDDRSRVIDVTKNRLFTVETASRFCSFDCLDFLELVKFQLPLTDVSQTLNIPSLEVTEENENENKNKNTVPATNGNNHVGKGKGKDQDSSGTGMSGLLNGSIVEKERDPSDVSMNFPVPGSKPDVHRMEQYRAEYAKNHMDENQVKGVNQTTLDLISEQLQELGIGEEDEDQQAMDAFANMGDEDDDEVEGLDFFDLSDIKDDIELAKGEMSFFIRLVDTLNQWSQPQEKIEDVDVYQSRFHVVNQSLSRGLGPLLEHIQVKGFTKPLALKFLQDVISDFNFSRTIPTFTTEEWEIISACLLCSYLYHKQKQQDLDQVTHLDIDTIITNSQTFAHVHGKKAKLLPDEFQTLVHRPFTIENQNLEPIDEQDELEQ